MEKPRRRNRWTVRIAALLALAFVLTVLSAWIPAWWMPTQTYSSMATSDSTNPAGPAGIWRDTVPAGWGDRSHATAKIGVARQVPGGTRVVGPVLRYMQGDFNGLLVSPNGVAFGTNGDGNLLDRYEIGWPIRTMTCVGYADKRPQTGGVIAGLYTHGIQVPEFKPLGMKAARHLPLRPIWARFVPALAVWFVVLIALGPVARVPGRWRRRKRLRSGRCLACGYDLTGIEACPECGAVPDRSHSATRQPIC